MEVRTVNRPASAGSARFAAAHGDYRRWLQSDVLSSRMSPFAAACAAASVLHGIVPAPWLGSVIHAIPALAGLLEHRPSALPLSLFLASAPLAVSTVEANWWWTMVQDLLRGTKRALEAKQDLTAAAAASAGASAARAASDVAGALPRFLRFWEPEPERPLLATSGAAGEGAMAGIVRVLAPLMLPIKAGTLSLGVREFLRLPLHVRRYHLDHPAVVGMAAASGALCLARIASEASRAVDLVRGTARTATAALEDATASAARTAAAAAAATEPPAGEQSLLDLDRIGTAASAFWQHLRLEPVLRFSGMAALLVWLRLRGLRD